MTQDFSIEPRGVNGACIYHLALSQFRQAPTAPGPRVHESVRGIA
jgi:hypothetical protein